MGVTAATPANMVIGAPGIVLLDSTDVGATDGNTVFRVAQTKFIPKPNGVSANLVGTAYIQDEHGELEVGTPEISTAVLAALIPGSTSASTGAASVLGSPPFTASTLAAAAAAGQYLALKFVSVTGLAVGQYINFGAGTQVRQVTRVGTAGAGGTGVDISDPLSSAQASGAAVTQYVGDGGTQYLSGILANRRLPTSAYHTVEARMFGLGGLRYVFGLRGAMMDQNFEGTMGDAALLAPRAKFVSNLDPANATTSHWYLTRIPADV